MTATLPVGTPVRVAGRPGLSYPDTTADRLLAGAARTHPAKPAIVAGGVAVTYAELDRLAGRFAAAVTGLLGRSGSVVAISSVLSAEYPVAYYGAMRAGHLAAPVNPLMAAPELAHVLALAGVRLAVVSPAVAAKLAEVRAQLPDLEHVVVLGQQFDELLAGEGHPELPRPDQASDACVLFTSGTTGASKAVRLTHRNLTVNALQTAHAHGLTADSVTLVHFPTYHPMHLNSAVAAGATQVLTTTADVAEAIELANSAGATHVYTLPMRLAQLASHPRLAELRLASVRVIASGGSALPARLASTIAERFGIPVVQGYGLAETSPLTHYDTPDEPRAGSVGIAVADTETRIVHLDTGDAQPAGELGEVHVRGPQVMPGYLGEEVPSVVDAAGWLATGDVGYLDEDGYLFLVDRIKDVFKCDNWLVAPAQLEAVAQRHPDVSQCVVVGLPDEVHGALAHAFVVPRPGAPASAVGHFRAFFDAQVPYYQRLAGVHVLDELPRSTNGKVSRRLLTERPATSQDPTTDKENQMVTLINVFTVNGDADEFERVFAASSEFMRSQPGFVDHSLVRSLRRPGVYVNIAHWTDPGAHQRVVQSEGFRAHIAQLAQVAKAEPDLYAPVLDVSAVQV